MVTHPPHAVIRTHTQSRRTHSHKDSHTQLHTHALLRAHTHTHMRRVMPTPPTDWSTCQRTSDCATHARFTWPAQALALRQACAKRRARDDSCNQKTPFRLPHLCYARLGYPTWQASVLSGKCARWGARGAAGKPTPGPGSLAESPLVSGMETSGSSVPPAVPQSRMDKIRLEIFAFSVNLGGGALQQSKSEFSVVGINVSALEPQPIAELSVHECCHPALDSWLGWLQPGSTWDFKNNPRLMLIFFLMINRPQETFEALWLIMNNASASTLGLLQHFLLQPSLAPPLEPEGLALRLITFLFSKEERS